MRECGILKFTPTTSTGLERTAKLSRSAGVLCSNSTGPSSCYCWKTTEEIGMYCPCLAESVTSLSGIAIAIAGLLLRHGWEFPKKNWRGSHHNNKHYPHPPPLQEKKRKLETKAQFLNNNAILNYSMKMSMLILLSCSITTFEILNNLYNFNQYFYLCYCYSYTYCTLLCCCWCFWTRQGIIKIQKSAAYPSITLRVNVDHIMSTMIISCYWEDTAHYHYSKLLLNELWSSL